MLPELEYSRRGIICDIYPTLNPQNPERNSEEEEIRALIKLFYTIFKHRAPTDDEVALLKVYVQNFGMYYEVKDVRSLKRGCRIACVNEATLVCFISFHFCL